MKARIIPMTPDEAGMARLDEAARALVAGRLVAFPTETVYGIGCNAYDADAVERLKRVKGRPSDKPFTLHVGRKEEVSRYVSRVPPRAARLMSRYWPGPLTIVFPSHDGQGVGIRMPSNRIAMELLKRTAVPVVAPSANRSGERPATTADQVARTLGEELDLILDGGPTAIGQASTVVRVTDEGWEVLREGSVTEEMLRRTLGKTIVFVCTANSCRSPMAEVLCKRLLADRLGCAIEDLESRGYSILSAGTSAFGDGPASHGAIEAMRRHGLDLSDHNSRALTPGLIEDADVIFVMARQHGDSIRSILPEATDRIRLLDPTGADISDPVGGSVETFLECADTIQRGIRAALDSL